MSTFVVGTYEKKLEYDAFMPAFLGKVDIPWECDAVIWLLSEADRALGSLNAYSTLIPDVESFIRMHVIKEATTSSRIEGTKTNIDDVVQTQDSMSPEKKDDWQEVHNYMDAMNQSIEALERLPLSMRLIKNAHKTLLSGVRGHGKCPGEIRMSQNWIGGGSLKSAFFIPPSHEVLPDLLSDLEKLWHREDIPALIRIALAHYQFETIHPFLDGNGRIGRLIITLHLVDLGILDRPTLYLSDFFEQYRQSYFDALSLVRQKHSFDQWLRFFLDGVIYTAQKSEKTLQKLAELHTSYEQKIAQTGRRATKLQALLPFFYKTPVLSPRDVEEILCITPTTANNLLRALEKIGIVREISGKKRDRMYQLHEYLELFRN